MRTILVGTLAATLVGCSCLLQPQTVMESCTDASGLPCFDRRVSSQPIEAKPASFTETEKAAIKIAAKTKKLSPDGGSDRPHLAASNTKSTMAAAEVEPPASGPAAEPSDPVPIIANTAIAAKTETLSSDGDRDKPYRRATSR
jgi:hypothetical protein